MKNIIEALIWGGYDKIPPFYQRKFEQEQQKQAKELEWLDEQAEELKNEKYANNTFSGYSQ